jgi:teichuronic acid biosynthesis glycosyltransferase TuaC
VDAANGVLVPARDADALAAALVQALERNWDEAALARRFSRDWEQVARETLDACGEALAETHAGRAYYATGRA